jgi:hypothetical protein
LTTPGRLTEALKQIPGAEAGTSGPRVCRARRKCGTDWATLASGVFTHADLHCGFGCRAVSGSRSLMAVSGDFRKRRGIRFGFMPARDARASVVPGYRNSISSPRNKGFCNLVTCDVEPRCCDQDLHYVTNRSPCLDRAAQQRCCERRYPAEATDALPIVSGIILRWNGRLRRSIRCESTRERWKTGR